MKDCWLCGGVEHHSTWYKVRDEDGTLRTFPGLECRSCGRIQPDEDAIDWNDEVPSSLRQRCEEVRSEARIKVELRKAS
jgi:hypothetical protein